MSRAHTPAGRAKNTEPPKTYGIRIHKFLLLISIGAPLWGAWGNGYSYRDTITISAAQAGAADATNFPYLVRGAPYLAVLGSGGRIQHTVTLNGQTVPADLIFTSDSVGTTLLSWEVASYTTTDGTMEAHVKIPILSHSANTVIYMFFGNAAITTYQCTASGAWNTSAIGIYHLSNGAALSVADSTAAANNLTNSGGATAGAGQIDGAAAMTAGQKMASVSTSAFQFDKTSAFSVSCWCNVSSGAAEQAIAGDLDTANGYKGWEFQYRLQTSVLRLSFLLINNYPANAIHIYGNTTVAAGAFHLLTATYDGSSAAVVGNHLKT